MSEIEKVVAREIIDAALAMIVQDIEIAGYRPGDEVVLALDCASSDFYRDGRYWSN